MAIILEAKAISKKYHQKFVLKDVNLIIHQHEKIGLIRANGRIVLQKMNLLDFLHNLLKQLQIFVKKTLISNYNFN